MTRILPESRRLGHDLHDRVLQAVAAAQRQLELHDLHCVSDPGRARTHVTGAQTALRDALTELRAIITGVAPDHHASLESALRAFIDSPMTRAVDVRLRVRGDQSSVPHVVHTESFLVLREAITNAVQHGDPTTISVRVDISAGELRACVEDDGAGFDPDAASPGVGLASMGERAARLGGAATVTTSPGETTRLDLVVPLAGSTG